VAAEEEVRLKAVQREKEKAVLAEKAKVKLLLTPTVMTSPWLIHGRTRTACNSNSNSSSHPWRLRCLNSSTKRLESAALTS
jgi:hypothetical protein